MSRKERERLYLSEYMRETWPEGNFILNVCLGPVPDYLLETHGPAKAAAIYRPTRPRVDAVKWDKDHYYLIEAKVREVKTGIGDLSFYRGLIPSTKDLPYYDGQAFIYRLVVPWSLDWINEAATQNGIEVVVYWRDWIADYVKERQNYFTKEYREARDEKVRLQKTLGVD